MLDKNFIPELENKIVVSNDPFPNVIIKNLMPIEIAKKAEEEFISFKKTVDAGCKPFQETKRLMENYNEMPPTIKKIVEFFNSKTFIEILEKKFSLKNIQADWTLHGGGLHESFKGGFLKVHSDFLYMRKSKLRRVLNLLIYLNSDWKENWGGALELWDHNMRSAQKSILPEINNAVIFRTDKDSNHGFPDPINCPQEVRRKSIALYYYVKEKTILPIAIKRRKYFHAVWKRRPNVNEPRFAENDGFFKRIKHRFFYRFF
jgi:Rps23 Pro-64 3,4-dihydroxylase Tpa1-like proline 4-hydroxylase